MRLKGRFTDTVSKTGLFCLACFWAQCLLTVGVSQCSDFQAQTVIVGKLIKPRNTWVYKTIHEAYLLFMQDSELAVKAL